MFNLSKPETLDLISLFESIIEKEHNEDLTDLLEDLIEALENGETIGSGLAAEV